MQPVRLTAGNFVLREPRPDDVDDALAMLQDADVRQWHPGPDELTRASVADWLERSAAWSDSYVGWIVAQGDRLVGNVYLANVDRDQLDAWVAYRTAPWARGRGIATAATNAMVDYAFNQLGLERLSLRHSMANSASCRIAAKTGFDLEGTERGGYRDPTGHRWDVHVHGLVTKDGTIRG